MDKIFIHNFTVGVIGLCAAAMAQNAFAARIDFKTIENNAAGAIVEVRIDPQSLDLNAVDGAIDFQGNIAKDLSVAAETGGSVLTIWPSGPAYSADEKVLRFTGGVPGGFGAESLLLRLRLSSEAAGEVKVSWVDGAAYMNNGLGTAVGISSNPITVDLAGQNESLDTAIESLNKNFLLTNATMILIIVILTAAALVLLVYGYKKLHKK